jgi:hypothetical protein
MQFQFKTLAEFGEWLRSQAEAKKAEAIQIKNVRSRSFTEGQSFELGNLASLIKAGSIVIEPPVQKMVLVQNPEEKKEERPSALNSDFLRWVKAHYSPRMYQTACRSIEAGLTEEQIRKELSGYSVERSMYPADMENE